GGRVLEVGEAVAVVVEAVAAYLHWRLRHAGGVVDAVARRHTDGCTHGPVGREGGASEVGAVGDLAAGGVADAVAARGVAGNGGRDGGHRRGRRRGGGRGSRGRGGRRGGRGRRRGGGRCRRRGSRGRRGRRGGGGCRRGGGRGDGGGRGRRRAAGNLLAEAVGVDTGSGVARAGARDRRAGRASQRHGIAGLGAVAGEAVVAVRIRLAPGDAGQNLDVGIVQLPMERPREHQRRGHRESAREVQAEEVEGVEAW